MAAASAAPHRSRCASLAPFGTRHRTQLVSVFRGHDDGPNIRRMSAPVLAGKGARAVKGSTRMQMNYRHRMRVMPGARHGL